MTNDLTVQITVRALSLESGASKVVVRPFALTLSQDLPVAKVVGPSGSGKTTFFKSLIPAFREAWTEHSRVEIDVDVRANDVPLPPSGFVGYAAQRPYFLPYETVRHNLVAPFKWQRRAVPSIECVQTAIVDFRLSAVQDRLAYQLSAGERQRLNIARMFLQEPAVAIIDECFSPMDEELAHDICRTLAANYTRRSRLLVTGHRRADLAFFRGVDLQFSYADTAKNNMNERTVNVSVQT